MLAQTCPSGDQSNVILVAAGIKRVRKQAAGNKSVLFFVGQAWSRAQPTSQVSRQLSLLPGAALLLSSQGEDAFEHEFGLFYVSRIFDRGLLSVLYNMEYRCELTLHCCTLSHVYRCEVQAAAMTDLPGLKCSTPSQDHGGAAGDQSQGFLWRI